MISWPLLLPLTLSEIANPDLPRIVKETLWFCWENGRPGYSPTPERRRYMQEYVAGRIPTPDFWMKLGRRARLRKRMRCGQGCWERAANETRSSKALNS